MSNHWSVNPESRCSGGRRRRTRQTLTYDRHSLRQALTSRGWRSCGSRRPRAGRYRTGGPAPATCAGVRRSVIPERPPAIQTSALHLADQKRVYKWHRLFNTSVKKTPAVVAGYLSKHTQIQPRERPGTGIHGGRNMAAGRRPCGPSQQTRNRRAVRTNTGRHFTGVRCPTRNSTAQPSSTPVRLTRER